MPLRPHPLPLSLARQQEAGGSRLTSEPVPKGLSPLWVQVFLPIRLPIPLPGLGRRGRSRGDNRATARPADSQARANLLGLGRDFHLLSKFPFIVGFVCWLFSPFSFSFLPLSQQHGVQEGGETRPGAPRSLLLVPGQPELWTPALLALVQAH